MRTSGPLRWLGGKYRMASRIVELMPPHRTYVEVFGGAAHVLFRKRASPIEVYNDVHSGLVTLFRVLRDPEQCQRLQELLVLTPYAREEYYDCLKTQNDPGVDDVERARRFYTHIRQAFAGEEDTKTWGYGVAENHARSNRVVSAWLSSIARLPAIHARLRSVQIEHDDFRRILWRYDGPETLFYLDPPYAPELRRSGKYEHEMTIADHQELVELLLNIEGAAILSGYAHNVYKPLEDAGWRRIDHRTVCHAAGRTRGTGLKGVGNVTGNQGRVETLWLSPARGCSPGQLQLQFSSAPDNREGK